MAFVRGIERTRCSEEGWEAALYMCARTSAHLAAFRLRSAAPICVLVNKDLGPLLSIPGSRRLSIITFNGLHMELASAGHISIPSYSNVRADCFP